MRRLFALSLLLGAPAALAQQSTAVLPYPYLALPTLSGAGFGSALSTPAPQAATGNPAALPAWPGAGLSVRASTVSKVEEEVRDKAAPPGSRYASDLNPTVSRLPHEAGAAWARGPLRVAVGYARPVDGEQRGRSFSTQSAITSEGVLSSRLETAGLSLAYAVALAPGLRVTPGVRLGVARVVNENRLETGGPYVTSYAETLRGSGPVWAVGVLVEGEALPVRFGVAFAPEAPLDGEETRRCTPPGALCSGSTAMRDASGRIPARLDASLGGTSGSWTGEAMLSRVFWKGDGDPDDTRLRDAFEGGLNVRYAARRGLSLALGFNQTDRSPLKLDGGNGEPVDFFRTTPTRFVLVGATLARGPLVLDAAYVNGSLLSGRGSRHHLGQLGVGYRF